MTQLTWAGWIHTVLAALGLVLGGWQLLRPKGGPAHRARGYAYVYAMVVGDCAAMLIFQFTGRLNILHFGAVNSLACIALGMVPVLRDPRPANWRMTHYKWMSWSYVGLLAAGGTELMVRTAPLPQRWHVWAATATVTIAITATGGAIIARCEPTTARG